MCDDKMCVSKLCDDKMCVSKLCDDKMCDDKLYVEGVEADDGRRTVWRRTGGYRTKNKNPTQRCGEQSMSSSATPATQSESGSKLDVTKCHACHTK